MPPKKRSLKVKRWPDSKPGSKHKQILEHLEYLQNLEHRLDESLEHRLFELKAVSYISLFLSAVLVALVLGILLRAIGI